MSLGVLISPWDFDSLKSFQFLETLFEDREIRSSNLNTKLQSALGQVYTQLMEVKGYDIIKKKNIYIIPEKKTQFNATICSCTTVVLINK